MRELTSIPNKDCGRVSAPKISLVSTWSVKPERVFSRTAGLHLHAKRLRNRHPASSCAELDSMPGGAVVRIVGVTHERGACLRSGGVN